MLADAFTTFVQARSREILSLQERFVQAWIAEVGTFPGPFELVRQEFQDGLAVTFIRRLVSDPPVERELSGDIEAPTLSRTTEIVEFTLAVPVEEWPQYQPTFASLPSSVFTLHRQDEHFVARVRGEFVSERAKRLRSSVENTAKLCAEIRKILARRDELTRAWRTETGFLPSESELVERWLPDGKLELLVRWRDRWEPLSAS